MSRPVIIVSFFLSYVALLAALYFFSESARFLKTPLVIVWALYVFFLPGYVWGLVVWKGHEIDFIERIALSIALSLGAIPILLALLNLLSMKITPLSTFLLTTFLIITGSTIFFIKRKRYARIT